MLGVQRFVVAAGAFETQDYVGRGRFPHWFAIVIFIGCVCFFLGCFRSLFDPEFRDRFLRFTVWHARLKSGTRISLRSTITGLLLVGSFTTMIGLGLLHESSEEIESYLGPFAVLSIFVHLISFYVDERRS